MFSWFRKSTDSEGGSEAPEQTEKLNLPGNVGTFELPASFLTEWEDEQTLLFCAAENPEEVTFRISVLSVVPKDSADDCGIRHVRESAKEFNAEIQESQGKASIHFVEESERDGTPLLLHFWYVGALNSVVIISATIENNAANKKSVAAVLSIVPAIVTSVNVTKFHCTLEGSDGPISMVIEEVPAPEGEERRPFDTAESEWLETALTAAGELSVRYGSGGTLTPAEMDMIFSRWLHESGEKEPAELTVDALGAAFGQFLVENHGFTWAVVTDQFGTEYAVQHTIGSNTAFPRSSVQKRIDDGTEDFLEPIYRVLLQRIEEAGGESST